MDVSRYDEASFVSPSGRIRCRLGGGNATCDFPGGMNRKAVPKAPDDGGPCTNMQRTYTSVGVQRKAAYQCWEEPVLPVAGDEKWWRGRGWPSAKPSRDHDAMPVLPYGKALRHNSILCSSEKNGMTCLNTSKRGFTIATAGVTFLR